MPMPNRPNPGSSPDSQDFIDETRNLFDVYSKERETWAKHAKED